MFKYSCSRSLLTNLILSQVSLQPDVVFPKRKGWEFYFGISSLEGFETDFFVVLVTDRKECIAFVPIGAAIDERQIRRISRDDIQESIKTGLDFPFESFQLIFLTSEKNQTKVLKYIEYDAGLLVLTSDDLLFAKGNFNNLRLEYRLSKLDIDPDLIPSFAVADLGGVESGISRSLFYQNFFHFLNRHWIQGQPKVALRSILDDSIPYWNLYGKKERGDLTVQIKKDLDSVFKRFFPGWLSIDNYRKKPTSQPETMIMLPDPPASKKTINFWLRKQALALDFLRDNIKQISIDILEFKS